MTEKQILKIELDRAIKYMKQYRRMKLRLRKRAEKFIEMLKKNPKIVFSNNDVIPKRGLRPSKRKHILRIRMCYYDL